VATQQPARPGAGDTEVSRASERGRHPRAIWLPAALSALLLTSIAVAFVWLSRQVATNRYELAEVLEPANRRLITFQLLFLDDLASWRAYVVQRNGQALSSYRLKHERTQRALDALSMNASRIGPEYARDLATLREAFAAWTSIPAAVLSERLPIDATPQWLQTRASLADRVVETASQLAQPILVDQRREMALLHDLERQRLLILAGLFPVALVGILLTAWFARRAMSTEERLVDNAAQESLVRDAIAALTGEQVLPTALHRIATNAIRMSGADGAFIEHSDEARSEVDIVAAVGTGAPPAGSRVSFVGSVTDDLVRAGTTELTADLSHRDSELGRALDARGRQCFALAVPLQSEGDVDGALVLIRRERPIQVRDETVSRLRALGAWAGLALRRQRLAAQLASEHSRLSAVVEEMPVGVVLAEAPSGRVVLFNRQALELWGSPASPPNSISEYTSFQLLRPDGQPYETEQRPMARALLEGRIVHGEEAELEAVGGRRKSVLINAAPIRDAGGVIIAGVATIDDISEEKRHVQATRFLDEISRQLASTLDYEATIEAVLQLLVPRLGDSASIHHRQEDGTIRRFASAAGSSRISELMADLDRTYPVPVPSPHPVAVAIRTGEAQVHEIVQDDLLKAVSRDEHELQWLRSLGIQSAIAVPLTVRGRTIGALQLLSMDPTHRYACEDRNLTEEIARRAALAIDNAQLFRAVNETRDLERFVADAALTLSGSLTHDEVLHRVTSLAVPSFADFSLAYETDSHGLLRHVASTHQDPSRKSLLDEVARLYRPDPANSNCSVVRALTTRQPTLVERVTPEFLDREGFEPRVRALFDELAPVSWMAIPLVARDRKLGAIVFALSGSERRYTDKDATVGGRLGSRAALAMHNALLYTTAQEALAARDEVLAIVAHDLRNPLHTIGMTAQLLTEVQLDESKRARQLETIGRATERMNRLIQDLLDVTRVEAGKSIAIERRVVRPSAFIRDACESFVLEAREKQIRLEWDVSDEVPEVSADVGRIVQVLSNLIGNALKFTPEGGRIDVRAIKDKEGLLVSVRDSGRGIPAEDIDRIFRPFWQAPRAGRTGAGLGLAISRGIVEQHGGRVWVESREGVGSTFCFTLPAAPAREARAA
jgi:PAS domain S-box-containing protein